MQAKSFTSKSINELILNKDNSRFAELYSGSGKEDDLIEYLLYTESADDVAKSIVQAGEFYPDRPLWVIKIGDKFLVKDGNRRCAAIKALQHPEKHGLNLPKFTLEKMPVLVYDNIEDLDKRIRQEHTSNLFKEWGRIAKALEVYKLYSSGNSVESMREIDSSPADLIKLASFYYEAVKIGGDDLKKLLRQGKGESGGKTIIFERLFKYRRICGYNFKNGPSYKIDIFNHKKFNEYISAMVGYLKENPKISHNVIDEEKVNFLKKLKNFGFSPIKIKELKEIEPKVEQNGSTDLSSANKKNTSPKERPVIERKQIPMPLHELILECYDLDHMNFKNAKTALTRISFECALKYVVENTLYDGKHKIYESLFMKDAFYEKNGTPRKYTNFDILKKRFTELIKNTGKQKAFTVFDLDKPHQIIHNYNVGAESQNAKDICNNLIVLLEFMLQDEKDLLLSLDLKKL